VKAIGIALLVLGIAGLGLGVAVIALASPAHLRCTAQTCEWHQPGLFGGSREVTYPIAQLHDSRTEYDTHRTGITTRWVVSTTDGTLELATTDSDKVAASYEQLARQLQDFLRQPKQRAFEASFPGTNRHPWIVVAIFGALALAGGIYLIRA
jgi:hypothetical protein